MATKKSVKTFNPKFGVSGKQIRNTGKHDSSDPKYGKIAKSTPKTPRMYNY